MSKADTKDYIHENSVYGPKAGEEEFAEDVVKDMKFHFFL